MIIGLNNREDDLVVNPLKGKKLTNMRAAGKDENVVLTPPIRFTLEQAMEFIDDDELIEVTPTSVRLRKRNLKATDRKRSERETADQGI
jgi:GTP-binding protein